MAPSKKALKESSALTKQHEEHDTAKQPLELKTLLEPKKSKETKQALETKTKQALETKTKQALEPKTKQALEPKTKQALEPKTKQALEPKTKQALEPKTKQALEPKTKQALEPKTKKALEPKPKKALEPKTKKAVEPKIPSGTKNYSDENKTSTLPGASETLSKKQTLKKEVKNTLKPLQVNKLGAQSKDGSFVGNRLRSRYNPKDDMDIPPSVAPPKSTGAIPKKKPNAPTNTSALGDKTVTVKTTGRNRKNSSEVESTLYPIKIPVIAVPEKKTTSKIINASSELSTSDQKEKYTKLEKRVKKAKTPVRPTGVDSIESEETEGKESYLTELKETKVKSRNRKKPDTVATHIVDEPREIKHPQKKMKTKITKEGSIDDIFTGGNDILTGGVFGFNPYDIHSMNSVPDEPNLYQNVSQQRRKKTTGALEESDKIEKQAFTEKQSSALTKNTKSKQADLSKARTNAAEKRVPGTKKTNSKKATAVSKQDGNTSIDYEDLRRKALFQRSQQHQPEASDDPFNLEEEANETYPLAQSVEYNIDYEVEEEIALDSTFTSPNTQIMNDVEERGQLFRGPKGEYLVNS